MKKILMIFAFALALGRAQNFDMDVRKLTAVGGVMIGSTPTPGLLLQNQTPAAAGAQQMSPALEFQGQGWKTAVTAASQTMKWRVDLLPVEGVANPSSELSFSRDINAGGFANKLRVLSSGRHVWEMDASVRNTARIQTSLGSIPVFAGENYAAGWPFAFQGRGSRGTAAAPAVTQSGDWLAIFEGMGRTVATVDDGDTSFNNFGGAGAGFLVIATELHSATAEGKRMTFFTTPNGGTIEKVFMVADQNGDVRIGKSQGAGIGTFDVLPAADLHIYDRTVTIGSTELRVQGGVGQGVNVLTQWMNNAGTQLAFVAADGLIQTSRVTIYDTTPTTGVTKQIIKAGAGQGSTNLLELLNNSDGVLATFSSSGDLTLSQQLRMKNDKSIFFEDSAAVSREVITLNGSNDVDVGIGSAPASGGDLVFWANGEAFMELDQTSVGNAVVTMLPGKLVFLGESTNPLRRVDTTTVNLHSVPASGVIATLSIFSPDQTQFMRHRYVNGGAGYDLRWPASQGGASNFLQNNGSGDLSWVAGLGGSGTTNRVSKFTASTTLGDSSITDIGTLVTIGADVTLNLQLRMKNDKSIFFEDSAAVSREVITLNGSNDVDVGVGSLPATGGDIVFWAQGVARIELGTQGGASQLFTPVTDNSVFIGQSTKRFVKIDVGQGVFHTMGSAPGMISLQATVGGGFVALKGAASSATTYDIELPAAAPTGAGKFLKTTSTVATEWADAVCTTCVTTDTTQTISGSKTFTAANVKFGLASTATTSARFEHAAHAFFTEFRSDGSTTESMTYLWPTARPSASNKMLGGSSANPSLLSWLPASTDSSGNFFVHTANAKHVLGGTGTWISWGANEGILEVQSSETANMIAMRSTDSGANGLHAFLEVFHNAGSPVAVLGTGRWGASPPAYMNLRFDTGGTAEQMKIDTSGIITGKNQPRVRVYLTANQTLPNVTNIIIQWPNERFDVGGMHDNATNNTRLTVPTGGDGLYLVGIDIVIASASGTWYGQVQFLKNGLAPPAGSRCITRNNHAGNEAYLAINCLIDLVAGDYIEWQAIQNSGGTLNIVADANGVPAAWLAKLW